MQTSNADRYYNALLELHQQIKTGPISGYVGSKNA